MKERQEKKFVPVMLTPFHENGEIDLEGLSNLTELYINAGAGGLFANCQSSEMFFLNDDEKLRIVKRVKEVANGKLPVVAVGNFGSTIEQQAEFINKIYDTGVSAVILVTGLVAKEHEPDEVFEDRVFKLLTLTGQIPLGFYECPEPYKKILTSHQLAKFVSSGRIIYHKDTCLNKEMVKEKIRMTADYPVFGLYDAYAVNAVESLKAGAAGLSCIQGNFFPELIVWLCNNYENEDLSGQVNKVQQFLYGCMDVVHHIYPTVAKYYLQKRGLNISTFTRVRAGNLSTEVMEQVNQLFDEYSVLQQEIGL